MNIKNILLSCLAFSSFSFSQAYSLELVIYSDGPSSVLPLRYEQHEGFALNCGVPGVGNVSLIDERIKKIIADDKFNGSECVEFKKQVNDIFQISDASSKLLSYMSMIGLSSYAQIPFFLSSSDGLQSYAEKLQENTGLPTDLGKEVLSGLQSAINEFIAGGSEQAETQKA